MFRVNVAAAKASLFKQPNYLSRTIAVDVDFKQNYFEIFQLPQVFDLDVRDLSERFLQLQKSVHPDKFVDASDREKRLSMQWATQVNEAYRILKSALPRAIYLLSLEGEDITHNPVLDPAFLMQQIELREELEEIELTGASLETLDEFKGEVEEVMKSLETGFSNFYRDKDLAEAMQVIYKLQFMNKLLVAAHHVEEKLLDY
jgi:molecular chaperone HscB